MPKRLIGGSCGLWWRLRVGAGLLFGLRGHDFRAARSFMNLVYGRRSWPARASRMCLWVLGQMFGTIWPEIEEEG